MSCFPNALEPRLVGITQFMQVSRHRGSNTGRFVGGATCDDRCEARCVVTVLTTGWRAATGIARIVGLSAEVQLHHSIAHTHFDVFRNLNHSFILSYWDLPDLLKPCCRCCGPEVFEAPAVHLRGPKLQIERKLWWLLRRWSCLSPAKLNLHSPSPNI